MNTKKRLKKPQFPNIYRRITESHDFFHIFKQMIIVFGFAAIFVFILFILADLEKNYVQNQQIQVEREKLIHEINIWKSFSDKYKDYKEVYFQIAVREFQLGDFRSARQYLQKSLFIDPNYEEALKLQKEIGDK